MYVSRAVLAAALLLIWPGAIEARPLPIKQRPLASGKAGEVSCENIEKYTTEVSSCCSRLLFPDG